jgi:nucleotide-binding universal stress UspA family protein
MVRKGNLWPPVALDSKGCLSSVVPEYFDQTAGRILAYVSVEDGHRDVQNVDGPFKTRPYERASTEDHRRPRRTLRCPSDRYRGMQTMQFDYREGYVPADLVEQDRKQLEKEITVAEAEFRNTLQARIRTIEWRSAVTSGALSEYIAREARSADLVITGPGSGGRLDAARFVNIGDLVMQVGRPVLVVPAAADELKLERIVIGWKDTRETQRAAFDALPLLKKTAHVTVVEICAEKEIAAARTRVEDVVGWLKWHGIAAESHASPSTGDDASLLNAIAQEQGANMIVAGAYGHSRLREWVLGGVTRDLLLRGESFSLLSH